MRDHDVAVALAAIPLELERVRTELMTGLQSFHNARPLEGARYVAAGAAGRSMAWGGSGRLVGWSLRATGGPVSVALRDSRDDSGEAIAVLDLLADASDNIWLGGGVSFTEGLYVDVAGAGSLEGALWLGAVD